MILLLQTGSATWSGKCDADGFAAGNGKYVLYKNDGSEYFSYQGILRKGIVDIKGSIKWSSGSKYIGDWRQGSMYGQGTYMWSNGSKYIGSWSSGNRYGYGKLILVPNDGSLSSYGNDAKKVGNVYVVEGMFERDKFLYHCKSQKDCDENEDKHLAARAAAKCNRYYPGYVGRLKTYAFLATADRFITKYVNKDRGMVTIEGIDGGNSLGYGEIREYDCGRLKEYEERAGNR